MIKKFKNSISELIFPICCVCCGSSTSRDYRLICSWCEGERFEPVSADDDELYPESVMELHSMWHFDKGGYLQQLLHNVKYNYLQNAGVELGSILGRSILNQIERDTLKLFGPKSPLLIPVPLHKSKLRKRGYNQARALAMGVKRVTEWDLIDEEAILRIRKTKTQTGLSSSERAANVEGAFMLNEPEKLENSLPVIVDDVFTTGATTFELAGQIFGTISVQSMIITVAKA